MANFLEGVGNLLMHPVNEAKWMFDSTKDVLKGDMKLKDIPGSHQEMMNDITVPLGGRNKLTENSDAVAGAIVGGVLAAPALMGAASSAGSSATSAMSNLGASDFARMGANAIRSDPSFDFKGGGTADYSTYYQPGKTKSQAANIAAATKTSTPSAPSDVGMFDTIKQGISDAGDYVGSKAKAFMPGKKVGDDTEVFGKINEFTKPEVLNKIQEENPFTFKGLESEDQGAFDGYFKTGELDRLKQYSNIGATDWKEDGSGGWGSSSMAEKGMDWRTSDQIKEAEDKMNFIPATYEEAKEEWGDEFDYEGLMEALKSVKPFNESIPSSGGRVGGGFRFNENLYKNRLLERELEQLYMAPLYNKYY